LATLKKDEKMNGPHDLRARLESAFPDFLQFTSERLFGEIWAREGLEPRDRSLITVALLCADFRPSPLAHHLELAVKNGVTKDEIKEVMMHVAFYAGWPTAMSAMQSALDFLEQD